MSVHFGFSEDKKPVLSGGKLSGDLDVDNWAILTFQPLLRVTKQSQRLF